MSNILNINDLPAERLPEFWKDNARINALYAPFRERGVNSRDFDSKLVFWKNLINTWCGCNKICTFAEPEIKKYFIHNDRVPACLSIVLTEMHKDKDLQTLSEFLEFPQKTWSGWAMDVAFKKPLLWSFNKVKNTIMTPITVQTKFVHLPTVRKLSENLFNSIPDDYRNKLITIEHLIELSAINIDTETVKLLLHYLQCQDKMETLEYEDEYDDSHKPLLVKVGLRNNKVTAINEVDIGKFKLEQNEAVLLRKLEELEKKRSEFARNTKSYLSKGMRQMAKNNLRKQHEIERCIEKQVTVLENVQVLIVRIGTAESDSKVVESYRTGLAALKSVFKENGLSEDSVSDTMFEIGETLESYDDIQTTLSQSVTSQGDAELEEELAELMSEPSQPPNQPSTPGGGKSNKVKAEEQELERRLRNLKFPSVPDNSPEKACRSFS